MRIALLQDSGVTGDPAANLERLAMAARRAASEGIELLIAPELYLSGYDLGDRLRELAEPAGGPSAKRAAEIAAETGVALLYGYPEAAGKTLYNAALLVDGSGAARANYRKTHLFGPEEKRLFSPGKELMLVELGPLTLGLMICYDVEFPEAVRALVLAGADLIAVPTALMRPYENVPEQMVPARAFENQVFIAYANRCGQEGELTFCGMSCVIGPDGKPLIQSGRGEAFLVAEIDPEPYAESRQANTYLEDRRPALYENAPKRL
ncbi:MAG: carbon-nitrogen hydrolase family protein [Kiloniellales bacterium]|nr:carbon-nitrogen hydrolase family protein [Kiloniellales bacterium]